ncbi:hypothetical protein K439DRAFT_1665571 [Ramaria rubella]|nr:hypothetical protein K439DRAFT_1665571 [Ramaria rubella]
MAAAGSSRSSVSSSPQAENALRNLLKRSGVKDRFGTVIDLGDWAFNNDFADLDTGILSQCGTQIEFLHCLKENWRPRFPAKLRFPEDWKPKEGDLHPLRNVTDCLARCELDVWVQRAGDVFSHLSQSETLARHEDPISCDPDFLLMTACFYEDRVHGITPTMETALRMDPEHSLEHFNEVVMCAGDERGTEAAISGAFKCIPGAWMGCNPLSRFPESLTGQESDESPVDFAVVLHLLSSKRELGSCRDAHFRLVLLRPALLVGIKGPAIWPNPNVHTPPCKRPKNLQEAITDLAKAVQPSLDAHLLNWQLHSEQLYEDASHIGFQLDSIPFAPVSSSTTTSQPWLLSRFRAAFALFSLQRHAFHLASLWERVLWPAEITLHEVDVEWGFWGPTPTPSEREDYYAQFALDFPERIMTSGQQERELEEEEREREQRALAILPDILAWIQGVSMSDL